MRQPPNAEERGSDHPSRPVPRRGAFILVGSSVCWPPGRPSPHPALEMPPPPPPQPAATPAYPAHFTQARARVEWAHFKARFIQADGRVIDNGNGGISHSEGQGLAMLFAVHFDEPECFARILRWTQEVLGRPNDRLLAWCRRPGAAQPGDRNNATDGDLLAAWALSEAAERWGVAEYHALAVAMARDILAKTVVVDDDRAMLLPGIQGFVHPGMLTLNPSYYVYPAFRALARVLPSPHWAGLERGGLHLARAARFGRWGLVPDWVSVPRGRGGVGIAHERPPRFSYDALRVPLYMVWAGHGAEPMVEAAERFWHDPSLPRMPAWAHLRTNEVSPYEADRGIAAVAQLCAIGRRPGFWPRQAGVPVACPSYYASALRLMAVMALRAMPATAR